MNDNNGAGQLVVYEGAMCCSTGICGPEPDKELIEFSETLKRLQNEYREMQIVRASLSFNVQVFLKNSEIAQMIRKDGPGVLPIVTIDEKVVSREKYPSYSLLKKEIEQRVNQRISH